MKELLFVIPMKDPKIGKSRLASVLPARARERLAVMLYRHVLAFLQDHQPLHDVVVVTGSDQVAALAADYGAQVLPEQSEGLNKAVEQAAIWAKTRYRALCILPADLAEPAAADLQLLLDYPRTGRSVTIAPAHDGGTNCLIAAPPDVIPFRYGRNSSLAHQQGAVAAGAACIIAPLSSFAYDIDTSADLHRLRLGLGQA